MEQFYSLQQAISSEVDSSCSGPALVPQQISAPGATAHQSELRPIRVSKCDERA